LRRDGRAPGFEKGYACPESAQHRRSDVFEGKPLERGPLREIPAGFEAVGEIDQFVQTRHPRRGRGVLADRREYGFVVDAETLARDFRTQTRVQHDRVRALEGVDGHLAPLALVE
jgi:hypothetical protein